MASVIPSIDITESSSDNVSSEVAVSSRSRTYFSLRRLAAIFRRRTQTENGGNRLSRLIFDPDKSFVFHWMGAVAIVTVYNTWMVTLRIAFPEVRETPTSLYLAFVDNICDVVYLLDIVVQIRTAYLKDGMPVFDGAKIRQYYAKQSYFTYDLVAAIPSETALSYLTELLGMSTYLCTVSAARLTRLAKIHVLSRFYDLADSRTGIPHVIRVSRLSLLLAIVIHWIACLYYLVSEYEGLGSNNWVYTNAPEQQKFSRKYIVCMYWSAMTLTTIGNTDSPETDLEYIFTGVIFLTGVFVFATVLGNVGDVISSMNANRQEFQTRMDHIKMYLTHKKAPASLQLKIKKWAEYSWSRTKATDESRLLNILPERLRAEVAIHVHLDSLKKVKIFEQCERGFLCELVLKLRSQVFSPGDFVCKAGETGREMFIINHGKVEVLVPNPTTHEQMVVAELCEGNYFGEISLLRLDGVQNRRTADVRSIGYSELLCLSRKDLMAALVEYPEAKAILESQAKQRIKTSLQAQRAYSVDALMRSSHEHNSSEGLLLHRDETRGKDITEIKTMIEDLRNSNKVPGRTIWQLIARCELLQARVKDKEKELQECKNTIRDLEVLLKSPGSSSRNRITTNGRSVFKITKQFSQDEARESGVLRKNCSKLPEDATSVVTPLRDIKKPPVTMSSGKNRLLRSSGVHLEDDHGSLSSLPCLNGDGHVNNPFPQEETTSLRKRSLNLRNFKNYNSRLRHRSTALDDEDLPNLDSYRLVNNVEKFGHYSSLKSTLTITEEDDEDNERGAVGQLTYRNSIGDRISDYFSRNASVLGMEDIEERIVDSIDCSDSFEPIPPGRDFLEHVNISSHYQERFQDSIQDYSILSRTDGRTLTLPNSRFDVRRCSETTCSGESRRSSFCSDRGGDTE